MENNSYRFKVVVPYKIYTNQGIIEDKDALLKWLTPDQIKAFNEDGAALIVDESHYMNKIYSKNDTIVERLDKAGITSDDIIGACYIGEINENGVELICHQVLENHKISDKTLNLESIRFFMPYAKIENGKIISDFLTLILGKIEE